MFRWVVVGCLLAGATALAQDSDGDGCDDARLLSSGSCVHPLAVVAPDVILGADVVIGQGAQIGPGTVIGDNATIADFANVAGRSMAGESSVIGARSIVGRRSQLGSGAVLGSDAILGRSVSTGTNLQVGAGAWIGVGSVLGDHVELGAGAVVGNLSSIGSLSTLGPNAVVARGVVVGAGLTEDSRTVVNGVVGPDTRIGASVFVSQTARVRKQAVIGEGARILANARVGRGVEIGPRATIPESAVIRGGASICNDTIVPNDAYIRRNASYPAEGCPCEPGYSGLPGACDDVDECALDLDDCGAFTDCGNTAGSFECDCQLGYMADIDGECVAVDADISGNFGANLANQVPNAVLESPGTVVVDGFEGELDVDVQTTGSGTAAVLQAFREGAWQSVTSVVAGDELRIVVAAPPGNGQSRSVTVTLFVGPTNVWVSSAWSVSTWTYSASGVSYGSCSAPCGGGSQSPILWSCSRSDGTSGHSQSNCSGGGAVSCNTGFCPFNARANGQMVTIRDPYTNADRYDVTCRNGGNGPVRGSGPSTYTIMSPSSVSANASSKEITVNIGNPGGRQGWYRMRFVGNSSLSVTSFNPGASGRHPYMCKNTSTSVSACSNQGGVDPQNCSSYIFCRVRDRNSGSYIYTSSESGTRAINCGAISNQDVVNLPVNGW